ncbi:unnamed protein product [Aphanomyces euteiches]|uniref:Uncharacterized protein n=1 Tax=Aphanomyces euteiches TaxID=100861 RepID=A0A6G0X8V3_9STRA|nr:hypothetical protein Ae201684_007401 [Aphanomyces euteiches]KAH9100849.1 hypothetical protein Ae201684P_007041 [Aphanomyces euteiches]KAH9144779.1 hypothetical protein AeRB84_011281 [Aphanomyces euteiches]
MSWNREPAATKFSSRKDPSGLKHRPRVNNVFTPGSAVTPPKQQSPQVWRAHDPKVDSVLSSRAPWQPQTPVTTRKKENRGIDVRSMETQTSESLSDTLNDDLRSFGPVNKMSIETVDFLIGLLTQRKRELETQAAMKPSTSLSPPPPHISTVSAVDLHTAESSAPQEKRVAPPRRSRSYEALVQLEAILETRHQQLMQHGVLEEYDINFHDKTTLVMTDIQDEIARMHTQLHEDNRTIPPGGDNTWSSEWQNN